MAAGNIYQVRTIMTLPDSKPQNVFYYREKSGIGGSSQDLANAFIEDVVSKLKDILTAGTIIDQVRVINGNNNVDNFVADIDQAGAYSGATTSPDFLAIAFRKRIGGTGFRYSYKRFSGIPASAIGYAGWQDSGTTFFTRVNALAVALGAEIAQLTGATYEPVQITGGFKLGVAPTFKTLLTTQWEINDRASHQDTRQVYEWKGAL